MKEPKVTVLMPVHNGERYLEAAIDSILSQEFGEFELLAIDDGSTDGTSGILGAYAMRDRRIRVLTNGSNLGLVASLDRGIAETHAPLMARMDADDLSRPDRLERQYRFMGDHPSIGLVGSHAEIWEDDRRTRRAHLHPAEEVLIRFELLFNNPFVHSSVMMRTELVREVGGYLSPRTVYPEDYDLWSRIAERSGVANIPDPLVVYRENDQSICRSDEVGRLLAAGVAEVSTRNILRCLKEAGIEREPEEIALFVRALNRLPIRRSASDDVPAASFVSIATTIRRAYERCYLLTASPRWYVARRIISLTLRAYRDHYLRRSGTR